MIDQSMPYTIRTMEPGDVPTVAFIEQLSFPTPWPASSFMYELTRSKQSFYYVLLRPIGDESTSSEQRWRRWLRGVVGSSEDDRIIGYMGFRIRGTEAHISTIAVHPDWREKGLGELLLLVAMEQAVERGGSVVSLEVRESNRVAQSLYRKYGFRFQGVHRGYYRDGEDAWLMEVEVGGRAYWARLARLRRALETRLCGQAAGVGQNVQGKL
jgi:ribosomal-protein-alanine N-acetyltransferase